VDPIVELILKNGVLGLLAGVGFYLFFRQLKSTEKLTDQILQEQVADAAAKTKLTLALEDLAETIKLIGDHTSTRMTGCQQHVTDSMQKIQSFMSEAREARAKEEGRREATNPRFRIPTGEEK
jgi:ABC-type nickel/cobalt efflux system permease component RcnA